VRARQGHEGALVPGDRKPRRDRAADHQTLLEKVDGGDLPDMVPLKIQWG
jgi:hypothetical protein